MDRTAFKNDMETALGGNLVDVELTPYDYDYAFNRAKKVFQQKGNHNFNEQYYSISVTKDVQVYTVNPEVQDIIRIIRPGSAFSSQNPFHQATLDDLLSPIYGGGGQGECGDQYMGAGGALLIYDLTMQYLENLNRVALADVTFNFNKLTKQITFLTIPKADETWFLEAMGDLTDEQYRDVLWVQEYALTELKIILGRAYRKFSNLSTPAGDNSLDGDQLVAEGREDQLRLLQDIKDYIDGDTTGGPILMG